MQELRAGRAGPAFTAELQRTIRAVAVARNFPPPEGHGGWDADAVWSAASEFMADAQTPRRLADLAVHCATADALRARLQGTVRNFLADIGRRTPIGKLVVRINDVLRGEPGFRLVGDRWARAGAGAGAGGESDPAWPRGRRPRGAGAGHRRDDGGRARMGPRRPPGGAGGRPRPPSSPCARPSSTPPAARSPPGPWPGPSATGWAWARRPCRWRWPRSTAGGAAGGRRRRREPTARPTRPCG